MSHERRSGIRRAGRMLAVLAALALAPGALAASHEETSPDDALPKDKKYERADTGTIERLESDALVVTDPGVEGATLRYATDPDTIVVRPDGEEAGLAVLRVGDRVAIDAHDRLHEGDPVAKVIHVVVEAPDDADAGE